MISMKNNEYEKIYELLKSIGRLDLISQQMLTRSFDEVYKIISIPEWKEEKFQGLLTSSIWNSNYNDVKKKLYLPYWEENKYLQLLKPSIFALATKNIEKGIELLKEYGIDQYVTINCLRKNPKFLKNLIEYLISNNIDLIAINPKTLEYGLNPILSCEKGKLKKKYNIDVEKIEKGGKAKC